MLLKANKNIFKRFVGEVLNHGHLNVVDEIFSEDFAGGLDNLKALIQDFRRAFPDLEVVIEDLVGEGDRVADRLINRGTHQGVFLGLQPTGVKATWSAIGFCRIQDGKIRERWQCRDTAGLLDQLKV